MFDTVIWATDGSDAAFGALAHALRLRGDADLVVAYAREIGNGDQRGRLQLEVDELRRRGVPASLVARPCMAGHVGRTLAEIAEETGAALIVLGTRGHTRFGGFVLGSVTQQLLRIGACPVLAVPVNASQLLDAAATQ